GACDPTIDPNCPTIVANCDPTVDPSCSATITCDPTVDPSCTTSSTGGTATTATCGDMMNGLPPNKLALNGLNPNALQSEHSDGSPIPYTPDELSTFSVTEGCFFGNLFKNDNVYSADDRSMSLTDADSSLRACALPDRDGTGASSNCAPIIYAGRCEDICEK